MPDQPRVASLYRYPVKSVLGEQVSRLALDPRGGVGDRIWSVRTAAGKIGSGKDTRRFAAVPGLLELRAARRPDGRVVITFPDGATLDTDDPEAAHRVSRHVGLSVTLVREAQTSHFDDGPVSLIAHASVAALAGERGDAVDPTRFRPNIVLDGPEAFAEDAWVGRELRVGTAVLHVLMTSPRCVMVNMKTADLPAQPGNLAALGRVNDAQLGVIANVSCAGRISVGDLVTVA